MSTPMTAALRSGVARRQLAAEQQATQTVGALPLPVNLLLYEGDDFFLDLTVTDSLGAAVDMTGATPTAQIRDVPDSPTLLATFTCTTTTNVIHLHLPAAEAAKLSAPAAVWDCQIATPNILTLVAGTVTVTPQVTE